MTIFNITADPNWRCDATLLKQGWQCPKCQAVMAPNTPTCFYCKPIEQTTPIPTNECIKFSNGSISIPLCRHGVSSKFNCHECSSGTISVDRQHYAKLMDDEIEINRGCHV